MGWVYDGAAAEAHPGEQWFMCLFDEQMGPALISLLKVALDTVFLAEVKSHNRLANILKCVNSRTLGRCRYILLEDITYTGYTHSELSISPSRRYTFETPRPACCL